MGRLLLTLCYATSVIYAPFELTRYIVEWKKVYGEFPPGGSLFGQTHWEIVFTWSTYMVGVCLVAGLSKTMFLRKGK